jgi:protein-tyrosine phosphatase
MAIIDFHSHVLPGIDDGSRDVSMSYQMLRLAAEQGVEIVNATPHFYASRDRIERFLDRRSRALDRLSEVLSSKLPQLYLGAEVAFFSGISTADRIEELCLEGTEVLLLELPFRPWSERDLEEVEALIEVRGFQVVLAHLERYLLIRENRSYIPRLMELPLQVQINAGSLLEWRRRGKMIQLFRAGQAHLLGSDCHNLTDRPPNLAAGRQMLAKKAGQECLARVDAAGERLLKGVTHV